MTTLALPAGTTDTDRFARALATLIGPAITARDGSLVAEDLRTLGSALADARELIARAVDQAHPGTATDLLPDLEGEYGLPVGEALSTAARQARLLAKKRARGDATRLGIERVVQTLFAGGAVQTLSAALVEGTDPIAVYRLVVLLGADWPGDDAPSAFLDALLAAQASAHVTWSQGRNRGFRCAWRNTTDDSRCDVDLLDR